MRNAISMNYFRYYVDPSTIRHSLGSTASTASSISQQSDGCNLVPLASSSLGSANGTSKGSEMIGTTIQLQLNSKKQNNTATQFLPNSISRYVTYYRYFQKNLSSLLQNFIYDYFLSHLF